MSLFRATSFRAALVYTLVLVVLVGAVLGFVFRRFEAQLINTQDNQIWREAASLSQIYNRDGARALAQAVNAHAASGQGLVLRLSTGLGAYVAGNMRQLPTPDATLRQADDWVHFELQERPLRARFVKLDADIVLLIGYDRRDALQLVATMRNALLFALIGLTLLGLLGGLVLARAAQTRVAAFNRHLQPVMLGALDRRLPVEGGHEWAQMAVHINDMLARIEQLMQATKQVSDNLAHDLRAPLTRLHMRLEKLALKNSGETADELAEALSDIDGLLRSFAALLTLSRLDSGVVKLARQPVDITRMVDDMHDLFEAVFEDADMQLVAEAEPIVDFTGDPQLMQQALTNLLENVLVHARIKDSLVTLSLTDKGDTVALCVADAGLGIAAEKRDAAQQRFVRLDASRSGDGSGLGLSLAAAIATHHGGTLQLDDNAPGLIATLNLPKRAV